MIIGITASTRRFGDGSGYGEGALYRKDNGVTIAVNEEIVPFTGWASFEGDDYYVVEDHDALTTVVSSFKDLEGDGEIFIVYEGKQLCLNRVVTTFVTAMNDMFYHAESFNQDISSWDVSNVDVMDYMFFHAKSFNQDLSLWCVSLIPNKPSDFDENTPAWEKENRQPVWGTCPDGAPV